MNHYILNPGDDLLRALEKDTPLVEYNFNYMDELTEQEVRDHENRIATLSIDIIRRSEDMRQLAAEMKADNEERNLLASTLDGGKTQRTAEMAVKFYDPRERTISIFARTEQGYKFVLTREALATEVAEWKQRQAEIAQQEIEAGHYRRTLYQIAGEPENGI